MTHHVTIPDSVARWVLRNRLLILLAIATITALALNACLNVPLRTTILESFMDDQTQFLRYRERAKLFGGSSDDLIYVATEEDELFTAEKLNAIRAAADDLVENMPEVQSVACLPDAPWIYDRPLSASEVVGLRLARRRVMSGRELPDADRYAPPAYWPYWEDEQEYIDLQQLKAAVLADELIHGVLVSRSGHAQAMVLSLKADHDVQGVRQVTLRTDIEETLRRHGLGAKGVHTAGVLISQGWMVSEAVRSMLILFPLGMLVVSVLLQAVFGRLSLVALTMFISCIAVIWSVGATAWVFGEITLMVAATPLLILVIATADTVHLASAYTAEVEAGADRQEALLRTIRDVGGACILTSVTTGVGFISLMVVPAATIRHAALAASVGVAGALLLALTLVPILLAWMPIRPPHARRGDQPRASRGINRLADLMVQWCKRTALNRPGWVVGLNLLLMVVALWGATRIDADADFPRRFSESHPFRVAIEFFNKELMGANTIEVYLSTDQQDLAAPETLATIKQLEDRIQALPEVESVASLHTLIRSAADAIELELPEGTPTDETTASGLMRIALMSGATESLLLPDQSLTRLLVRVAPTRLFKMLELAEQIQRLSRGLPPGLRLEVTGMYPIVGKAATAIIDNQVKGFVLCFASVMTLVALGLRSLRLSLMAVAPNVLPLCLLAGALGLFAGQVDTDAMGIAVVSFGLAVDDTIHFLHRYDIEWARTRDVRQALSNTFDYTGQAIVRTTLILAVGMSPFALSGYLSIQMLGTYLVMVLCCAVLGDLLLLPATIVLLNRWRRRPATPLEEPQAEETAGELARAM